MAHLDGGYQRWVDEGLPVFPPDPRLTGTATAGRAHVEFVVPDDHRRALLRVRMDDEWVGDLLPSSVGARDALLGALTAGEFSVVAGRIFLPDLSIVEAGATADGVAAIAGAPGRRPRESDLIRSVDGCQ